MGEYFNLHYYEDGNWKPVSIVGWGAKIKKDPIRPGTIWAATGHEIVRTDGVYRFSKLLTDIPELNSQSDTFSGLAVAPNGIAWIGCSTQNQGNGTLLRINANNGTYQIYRRGVNWPFPGHYVQPLAVTPEGKLWLQYDSDYPSTAKGLCWFDGRNVSAYPAPAGGEPQWGGLPHAQIGDIEVKPFIGGYELWMNCISRGIAVMTYHYPRRSG